MTIYFSEIFKKLRKGKSMTQEQIAEVLRVSPQAVSRWETGATYPDIALLPNIAEFFETTVDALLGTGKARAKERIEGFLRHSEELLSRGELSGAADLMRSAVKEFPNSYELQFQFLLVLLRCAESGNPNGAMEGEIIDLGELILTHSTDDRIRLLTKVYLGRYCCSVGKKERAREIFATLPEEEYCLERQMMLADDNYLPPVREEAIVAVELPKTVDAATLALFHAMKASSSDEPVKVRLGEVKRRLQILDAIYEESDYDGHYLEHAAVCTAEMAELYAEGGDNNRALLCLSKTVECAMDAVGEPLSGSLFGGEGEGRSLLVQIREDLFTKPCFASLAKNPEYLALLESLQG